MRSDWLTLGSEVASNASDDAEEDAGPGVDETRGRGGSDETRNGTRAPADHGPLLGQTVIEETPGHGSEHGGEAGVPSGHDSAEVGTERGATVEAEPAEPKEDGAESDERDVVRTEVHHHLLVAAAQDPRVGKGGHTRANLDGNTTGVVEDAVSEAPAVGVPDPVGERAVHEGGPEEGEDHGGNNAATLSDSADGKSSSDSQEHHLVERVQQSGDQRGSRRGSSPDLHETEVLKVTNEGVSRAGREGEGVSPEIPLKYND